MNPDLTFDEEIQALLEYNPPSVQVPPGSEDVEQPLSFYDKHLSSNLGLKRVVHLPTLLHSMSKAMDACLDFVDAHKIDLPLITHGDDFPSKCRREIVDADTESIDASSIAQLYAETTGGNCEAVSSMLFLTPRCSMWLPAFGFTRNYMADNPADQAFTVEEYSVCLDIEDKDIFLYPEVKECLTDDKLQLLRRLFKRDRRLATWEFLPYTTQAIAVIQNLGGAKPSSSRTTTPFKMSTYPPIGKFHSPVVPLPYDAETTPGRPHISRRSSRVRKSTISPPPAYHRLPTVHIASQPPPGQSSTVDHVLQHAWVTACRRDSTFIIFQCGNYERIGIRDRASQTLYLSDIIDVPNSKTPGSYAELHINLYISILDDAVQRAAHLYQPGNPPAPPRKRQSDADEPSERPRQRLKLRSHSTQLRHAAIAVKPHCLDFLHDVCQRHLLLLSIQYGVYSSPNPATFFRCGHRPNFIGAKRACFKPNEYVQLKLTSLITRGATGTVHEGILEVYHDDRELITYSVVAKLAFGDSQIARMRHEANIYEHLTKAGVCGIPRYYGIFEDLHHGPVVLVTSHEGFWLRHWVPEGSGSKVPMLWRKRFLLAMKEIHHAGVCHRDIRPENLLVNADGAVCIIDFDKADLTSSVGARKREYEHLDDLLAGSYTPPGSFPSPKTASSGSGLSPSPIPGSD